MVRQQRPWPAHRAGHQPPVLGPQYPHPRIQGPASTATIQLDYATIRDGQQLEHHRHRHRNASANVTGGHIRLRAAADIRPGTSRPGTFSDSTDGTSFTRLGPAFTMGHTWQFFTGHRFALSGHAAQALGGCVHIARFALTAPRAQQHPSRI
ncbi:hypothetical protein [Streptomyces pseudovenezuelae]